MIVTGMAEQALKFLCTKSEPNLIRNIGNGKQEA